MKIIVRKKDIEIIYEEPQTIEKYPKLVCSSDEHDKIINMVKTMTEQVIQLYSPR